MAQYFGLTLDTLAPQNGVLNGLQAYYNGAATVTVSADGASFMKVWVDQKAVGEATDAPASWEVYATSKALTPSTEGTNYFHAMFMDSVGNIGVVVNSASFIYDTTGPTVTAVEGPARVNVKSVTEKISFSDLKTGIDAVSGVATITVTGVNYVTTQTFTLDDTDRTNGYKNCTITLTAPSDSTTTCTFTVAATDRAGNTGSSVDGAVIYDDVPLTATMTVMDKDCSAVLPDYVNSYDYGVKLESTDTDIAGYKVWEGNTEPTDWTTWPTGETAVELKNLTFSTGEGEKVIHAKVKDTTENVTTITPRTITVDMTAPEVTLTADKQVISAQTGFDTVTFTYAATDAHTMPEYELYVDGVKIKNGTFTTGMTEPVTEADIVAKSAGEGAKVFTLKVKDVAGNWGTSGEVTVKVDLTAPTGSVTASATYATQSPSVTIAAEDTGGSTVTKMKVWYGSSEPTEWSDYATSHQFTNVPEGQHVAHVKFMDAVGNASAAFDSTSFIVDVTAPHLVSATIASYTNNRTFSFTFEASDSKDGVAVVSGMSQMKVWQSGEAEPTAEAYVGSKTLQLTGEDGTKTLVAKFKDVAGNWSDQITLGSTILDLDKPDAQVVLYKSDNATLLPAKVNVRGFVARISATDTQTAPITQYKLTGDFDQASTEWKTFTVDEGKTYMSITGLTLTETEGLKTITVVLKDAAGNESAAASATVTYDVTAPVIDITGPDHNIVSKQHTLRLNSSATALTTYNDESIFSFSCAEKLVQYKVCVNEKGQTAEDATAIGTAHGSENMTGTNVEANTPVTCKINGADFAATSKVNETDGAYEVIVYGKDEAGTWSAVHVIE